MSRAAPASRHVMLATLGLIEMIEDVLARRVGEVVAQVSDKRPILESLLEEYFYGGSFQDEFYEALTQMHVPTLVIESLRQEILYQISSQISAALGGVRPSHHYSFVLTSAGDLRVTETPPRPVFRLKTA